MLAEGISDRLAPIRERARDLRANPDRVNAILADGTARARQIARVTLGEVFDRMGLDYSAHD